MRNHPQVEPAGDAGPPPAAGTVRVYATGWCPYCAALLQGLGRLGIAAEVIDIDADEEAARYVERVNQGNRTVPTVLFPDGTTRTNPDPETVLAVLTATPG